MSRTRRDGAAPRLPFRRQAWLLLVALLVVVVGVGFVLVAVQTDTTLEHQYEQRALGVARAVAAYPGLADAVAARDQPRVQAEATSAQQATGALFVVVTDDAGIRLAHPDPSQIGKPVSTSPDAVLQGAEVANIERGTLGLSARGKVPLRAADGAIVGEVSVGFDASDISGALDTLLARTAAFLGVALLLGIAGAALLTWLLKRRTFGLEPHELADLVREREAVLYGVSDGVVAVDADGRVTAANAEASRLLGCPVETGFLLADLELPRTVQRLLGDSDDDVTGVAVAGERVLVVSRRAVRHDGRALGSVVTVFDRTEVENLTDELSAVRLMTQALRAQRHEFANRLHTVHGLLQTSEPEEAAEYVSALLDAPDVAVAADRDAIGSSTLRAFLAGKTAEAAEQGVALVVADSSWVPQKLLAPVEVVTVLGNLVNNAIEAAHDAPRRPATVEVDLLADGGDLVVSVADTGAGIAPDAVPTLFVEGVSTRGSGRGLGLAIVARTVAALGGTVELTHPGGPGAATVFVARLPDVLETAPRPAVGTEVPAP